MKTNRQDAENAKQQNVRTTTLIGFLGDLGALAVRFLMKDDTRC